MRRFPTARENFPSCPECQSRAVRITLLTDFIVAIRCDRCTHGWTVLNDDVESGDAARSVAVADVA